MVAVLEVVLLSVVAVRVDDKVVDVVEIVLLTVGVVEVVLGAENSGAFEAFRISSILCFFLA